MCYGRQRDFRQKLSRRSQPIGSGGWISRKVGRKCKVKPDGTFPRQQNLTVAVNCLAHKQYEREETKHCMGAKPDELFKKQNHTHKPSQLFLSVTGDKSIWQSQLGRDWVCVLQHREPPCKRYPVSVCVRAYGGMRMWGRRHYITCSSWSLHLCQLWDRQQAEQIWQQCSPVVKYNKHKQTHTCNQLHRSGCVYHHLLVPI